MNRFALDAIGARTLLTSVIERNEAGEIVPGLDKLTSQWSFFSPWSVETIEDIVHAAQTQGLLHMASASWSELILSRDEVGTLVHAVSIDVPCGAQGETITLRSPEEGRTRTFSQDFDLSCDLVGIDAAMHVLIRTTRIYNRALDDFEQLTATRSS